MRHVGTTASVDDALRIATESRVSVALVDLLLTGDSGLRFARVARSRGLAIKVAFMSIDPNPWAVKQARAAGASGFIHKEDLETGPDVVAFIRRIANGEAVFSERVSSGKSVSPVGDADLTEQQWEIIRCLSEGMSTEEIARHLSVIEQTVRNKILAISKTLGVSGRVEILAWAATTLARPRRALK